MLYLSLILSIIKSLKFSKGLLLSKNVKLQFLPYLLMPFSSVAKELNCHLIFESYSKTKFKVSLSKKFSTESIKPSLKILDIII